MYTLLGRPLEAGNWKSRGMTGFGLARMFLDGASSPGWLFGKDRVLETDCLSGKLYILLSGCCVDMGGDTYPFVFRPCLLC